MKTTDEIKNETAQWEKYRMKLEGANQQLRHNLEILLAEYDLNELELSRQSGLSQPAIHKLLSGMTDHPRLSSLKLLASFFNITLGQLVGEEPLPQGVGKNGKLIRVPLIPWEQAIDWQKIVGSYTPSHWTYWTTINTLKPSDNSFALTIEENMENELFALNSVVIVDPDYHPHVNNYVIVYNQKDKSTTIKKLILEGKKKWLDPLNKKLKAIPHDEDNVICGVIIQKNVPLVRE